MNEKRRQYQEQYKKQYSAKTKRVNLTLTNQEYRAFLREAKAEGMKLTSYIKQLALTSFSQQAHIPSDLKDELKTLRFTIHNIANNVNQIAHYSNTVHSMTASDENNLLQYLKQLDDVIQSYTKGRILKGGEQDDDH